MLGGTRRPARPDYIALACRALNEVLRIDKRLLPFMVEQREALERGLRHQESQAALLTVYGGTPMEPLPSQSCLPPLRKLDSMLFNQELALAKSRALLARLRKNLGNR
jgi:hypothetical protein